MIDFMLLTILPIICYFVFRASLRKAVMNQAEFEAYREKMRQRRIDILYGRDLDDE